LAEQRPTGASLGVLLRRSSSLVAAVVVGGGKGVDHNFSGRVYSSTDINARLPFAVAGSQSYGAAGRIIRDPYAAQRRRRPMSEPRVHPNYILGKCERGVCDLSGRSSSRMSMATLRRDSRAVSLAAGDDDHDQNDQALPGRELRH